MKRDNANQKEELKVEVNDDPGRAFSAVNATAALQARARIKSTSLPSEHFHHVSMFAEIKGATSHSSGLLRQQPYEVDFLPEKLPSVTLRHGQVLWLLTAIGYRGPASTSTFYEYVKSLRKFGIPFGDEKFRTKRKRRLADYSYRRIMELAIALSLRVYHVVPDAVLNGLVQYRSRLDRLYRRAYAQRNRDAGRLVVIQPEGNRPIVFRGLFLDLNIEFSGGRLVRFGPPKLLSAIEALQRFSQSTEPAKPFLPMSLSTLSQQIISLALQAPNVHSGPQLRRGRGTGGRSRQRQRRRYEARGPIATKLGAKRG